MFQGRILCRSASRQPETNVSINACGGHMLSIRAECSVRDVTAMLQLDATQARLAHILESGPVQGVDGQNGGAVGTRFQEPDRACIGNAVCRRLATLEFPQQIS